MEIKNDALELKYEPHEADDIEVVKDLNSKELHGRNKGDNDSDNCEVRSNIESLTRLCELKAEIFHCDNDLFNTECSLGKPINYIDNSPAQECNQKKVFSCQLCEKSFSRNSSLKVHMRNHTGERPFTCEICGKSFSLNAKLVTHRRIHNGDKPYKCEECEKSFCQSSHLVRHRRVHQEEVERPFACDVCGKSFTAKSTLINHWRIHTGERPFVCEFCDKAYLTSSCLASHRRSHSKEKPYVCDICEKLFTSNSILNRHRRNVHRLDQTNR